MKTMLILLSLCLITLVLTDSHAQQSRSNENGEIAGGLGFGAMTIDAYYEICFAKGARTDNNLNGIDKILKDKWGFSYSGMLVEVQKQSGRSIRQEAHKLIRYTMKKTGGCDTKGMKAWFTQFAGMHESNLKKFHAMP